MLVENQTTKIKFNVSNRSHYLELGYTGNLKDEIDVKVEHLTKGSHVIVKFECDYCHKIFERPYKKYLSNRISYAKDACSACRGHKQRDIFQEKYGVDHPLKVPEILKRHQDVIIEKYGSNSNKTRMFIDKAIATNIERYGVANPMHNKQVQDKLKNTINEIYGVDNVFQSEEIKNKARNTIYNKYGVDNISQTEYFSKKLEDTMLRKYGVKYWFQSEEFKQQARKTNIERYGVLYPMQNNEVQIKAQQTNLERYGVLYPLQSPEIQLKATQTYLENGTIKTSSQQKSIFDILIDTYDNIEMNFPLSTLALDIAVWIGDIPINIEYDSAYWHQDQQRDRRRDEFVKSQGWKVLRIKSGHKIPTIEQLQEAIDKLLTTDRTYTEIKLDDWKDYSKTDQK